MTKYDLECLDEFVIGQSKPSLLKRFQSQRPGLSDVACGIRITKEQKLADPTVARPADLLPHNGPTSKTLAKLGVKARYRDLALTTLTHVNDAFC